LKRFRKYFERFIEGVLFTSSTVTSLTVLFIVIFLFKEGIGLFNSKPVEKNYIIAVNAKNPVNALTSKQLKEIFNQQTTNWKDLGGNNDTIILFTLSEAANIFLRQQGL
jgi:phosphate transport system permease protein